MHAQTRQITGTVTSATDGSSIPGAAIVVQGTTIGTVSDFEGSFSLSVPVTATSLMVSFVGYTTQVVAIEGRNVINIALESQVVALDELVVVGYGVQRRRDLAGSVATVRGEDLRTVPVQSFEMALQGKAAGVNITIPNAVLGNPPVIRVRGVNSISGSSSPLIVIDGVPVFTGDLSRTNAALNVLGDLNPADIESLEILKDASATAIYGSRAANGVILITTRRAQRGTPTRVTYDGSFGFTNASRIYEMMNAEQFVGHKNHARANVGLDPAYFLSYDADGRLIDTDWNDVVYQTGIQHNHSLTFSGASEATNYFVSLGFSENEGIIRTNTYDRRSARVNIDHRLSRAITLGANVSYSNSFSTAPSTGSLAGGNFATAGVGRIAFLYAPIVGPYTDEPNGFPTKDDPNKYYNITGALLGRGPSTEGVGFFNPEFLFDYNYHHAQSERILSTIFANVELVPNLILRTALGYDNSGIESKTFWDPRHGDGTTRGGDAYNYFDRRNRWNWTNTLNYMFSVNEMLNFNVLLGSEEQHTVSNGWSGGRTGLADPFFTSYQGSFTVNANPPTLLETENYFTSLFGRFNFNISEKYYFELSARRDGFSGLAAGNKYGQFGGASAMWNISRESFIADSPIGDVISDLRLKASYGKVGNISAVSNFGSLFLYAAGRYNGNPTLFFNQAGNADLFWETSHKLDLGLSFGLFRDRFQFDVNYYKNDVDGLVLNVPQSPSKGIPGNTIPANVGAMLNRGIEVSATSNNYSTRDFRWVTILNFTSLTNEVTALAPGVDEIIGVTALETTNRTKVGYPVGQIWGVKTDGVDPQTGRRVFISGDGQRVLYDHSAAAAADRWLLEDGTRFGRAINITDDGQVLGNPHPKYFGGLENTFIYRNFDATVGMTYAFDFYVYNGSKAGLRDQRTWNNTREVYENAWRNPGDITNIPKPIWGDNVSNGSTMVISENVERADFLKLRNLSIGYTLRNDRIRSIGISNLRIYTQAFNLLTFTGYSGADPEISSMGDTNLVPGVDRNTVPQARTLSFGVNASF
jgi:TonB-dependent starch-binding outer membrane protein SusC